MLTTILASPSRLHEHKLHDNSFVLYSLIITPQKDSALSSIQIARYVITFGWLYHGLFPKLIQIAPLEMLMSGSAGLTEEQTYIFIKAAGFGELILGGVFFFFYRSLAVLYLNITALTGLLLAVSIIQPQLLIEAFNPVTTNISLIAFSIVIIAAVKQKPECA